MSLSTHTSIIELGFALQYFTNTDGCCYGVTLKWLEACLLGKDEESRFIKRIEKICSTNSQVLIKKIDAAKDRVKRLNPEKSSDLIEDDQVLLEILALYEGIELYQLPEKHFSIFNQNFEQDNVDEVSEFAASEKIKTLETIYSEPGIYTQAELTIYLESLKTIIKKNPQKVGFLLTNDDHTVGLLYDATHDVWTIMDINLWPPYRSGFCSEMAEEIFAAFNLDDDNPFTVLNTRIIISGSQQIPVLIAQLVELRKYHLGSINQETATRKGPLDFLYLALKDGHLDVVKALLHSGANPNLARTSDMATPLHFAALHGPSDFVRALLDGGANPNLALSTGETPLLIAAENDRFDVIDILLKNESTNHPDGIDLNLQALCKFLAARHLGEIPHQIIQLFFEKNVSIEVEQTISMTPNEFCIIMKHQALLEKSSMLVNDSVPVIPVHGIEFAP